MKKNLIAILKVLSWIWIVFWILAGGFTLFSSKINEGTDIVFSILGFIVVPIIFLIWRNKVENKNADKKLSIKNKIFGIIMSIIIIVGIVIYGFHLINNPESNVEDIAKDTVMNQLKSPSTAEFGPLKILDDKKGGYFVSGYVDSQNSFGAIIRKKFTVWLEKTDKGYKTYIL